MDLYTFLVRLRNAHGLNDKIAVIQDGLKRNPMVEPYLRYTYDADLQYYVAEKVVEKIKDMVPGFATSSGPYSTVEELWESDILPTLLRLDSRELSGAAVVTTLAQLAARLEPTKEQAVFYALLTRDLRAGITANTINKAAGRDLVPVFAVQLARTYDPQKYYIDVAYWYASPKLDGLCAVYKHDRKKLYTRQGKELTGFTDIVAQCAELCKVFHKNFIDGELFSPDYQFQDTQGAIVAKKPTAEHQAIRDTVCLNVFALLPATDTRDMVETLHDLLTEFKSWPKLRYVPQEAINNNPGLIMEMAKTYVESGYEGIMLRHPVVPYSWMRDNHLLKFKFFNEMDVTIRHFFVGKGKYAHKLGGFVCIGTLEDGREIDVEIGSGFSDDERERFWQDREKMVGQTIEVTA